MKHELTEEERYTLYRRTFTTPEGAGVLDDLRGRYLKISGLSPANDPNYALVLAAQRAVILDIERYAEVRDEDAGRVRSDSEPDDSDNR